MISFILWIEKSTDNVLVKAFYSLIAALENCSNDFVLGGNILNIVLFVCLVGRRLTREPPL